MKIFKKKFKTQVFYLCVWKWFYILNAPSFSKLKNVWEIFLSWNTTNKLPRGWDPQAKDLLRKLNFNLSSLPFSLLISLRFEGKNHNGQVTCRSHTRVLCPSPSLSLAFSPLSEFFDNPETFGKVIITVCPILTTFTKKKKKKALVTLWLLFNIKYLFAHLPATWDFAALLRDCLLLAYENAFSLCCQTQPSVVGYTLSPCLVSRVIKAVQSTCSVMAVLQIPTALRQEQNFHFSAQ